MTGAESLPEPLLEIPKGRDLVLCLVPAACHLIWLLFRGGLQWGDGLEFAAVSSTAGVAHPTGYPLYTILGWLALLVPLGEPFLRMLALSVALGVAAVWVFYSIAARAGRLLGGGSGGTGAAAFSACLFGVSGGMISMCTVVEVYLLNVVLVLLLVHVSLAPVVKWREAALATLSLVMISWNHLPGLAALPFLVVVLWRLHRGSGKWPVAACAAAVPLLTVVGYLTLLWRSGGVDAHTASWGGIGSISALLAHVRGGEYAQFQLLMESPGRAFTWSSWSSFAAGRLDAMLEGAGSMVVGLGVTSRFAGAALLAAAGWGLAVSWPRGVLFPAAACVVILCLAQICFLLIYNIPDYGDYVTAISCQGAVLAIVPIHLVARRLSALETSLPVAPILGAGLLAMPLLTVFVPRMLEENRLPLLWWERIESALPEGAAVITQTDADTYTFWYQQMAAGRRKDVTVYGANFQRFPWFRLSIPPEARGRGMVGFEPGPPGTLGAFVGGLRRLAIDPLLAGGPVFMTQPDPFVMRELAGHYRIEPRLQLLTDAELEYLLRRGEVNFPPPMLFEILPKGHRP